LVGTLKIIRKSVADYQRKKVILSQAKKKKEVVYGAQAMNVQVPIQLRRPTDDFDMYSKKPGVSAKALKRKMNALSGFKNYYVKPAQHPGTWKVMDIGYDLRKNTEDDFNIADYTKPAKKPRTTKVKGVHYVKLNSIIADKKASLRDPAYSFRHQKDQSDLNRMVAAKRLMEKKKMGLFDGYLDDDSSYKKKLKRLKRKQKLTALKTKIARQKVSVANKRQKTRKIYFEAEVERAKARRIRSEGARKKLKSLKELMLR